MPCRMSKGRDQSKKVSSAKQNILKCTKAQNEWLGVSGQRGEGGEVRGHFPSDGGAGGEPRAPPPLVLDPHLSL